MRGITLKRQRWQRLFKVVSHKREIKLFSFLTALAAYSHLGDNELSFFLNKSPSRCDTWVLFELHQKLWARKADESQCEYKITLESSPSHFSVRTQADHMDGFSAHMNGGGSGDDVDHLTAKLLLQWDWKNDGRHYDEHNDFARRRPSSHESSPFSTCPSPEVQGSADSSQLFVDFSYHPRGRKATQTKSSRPKMSTKRRMKASEREKMRMRSLAEALHQLRDYLPPIYSRRGQPLTKIQTLKYTIEYIKELSELLNQEWDDDRQAPDIFLFMDCLLTNFIEGSF